MLVIPLCSLVGGVSDVMSRDTVRVIVYKAPGGSVGIAVDHIKDILDVELTMNRRGSRPGLRGAAIVSGRITDVLDLGELIAYQLPGLLAEQAA